MFTNPKEYAERQTEALEEVAAQLERLNRNLEEGGDGWASSTTSSKGSAGSSGGST